MATKSEWREFYVMQKSLWQWLAEHCKTLYRVEDCEPIYTVDDMGLEHSPKYVRAILQIKRANVQAELLQRIQMLDEFYKKLTQKNKSHDNLPYLLSDVTNITISKADAYRSLKLVRQTNKNELPQYLHIDTFATNHSTLGDVEKMGLEQAIQNLTQAQIDFKIVTPELGGAELYATHNSILDFAKSERVQARIRTGLQYRAMVRQYGSNISHRHKLGFIVLDYNTNATIYDAIPEPKRKHSLQVSGDYIHFPCRCRFELYRK